MKEVNLEAVNTFLQEDHSSDNFKQKLKDKCLETDSLLRKAVEEREKLVEEAKALQAKLDSANTEIVRLNGSMQGHVELISELMSTPNY